MPVAEEKPVTDIQSPHEIPDTAPPLSRTPAFRDVLQVKSFRDLWLGQAISQLGDALYYMVFLFMADKLTGDPLMVGAVGVAGTLPFLLLSLHAGVVADRKDRRRILLFSDFASAALLFLFGALIYVNPAPPAWWLMGAAATLSTVNVYFAPAKSAAIPQLVPPALLPIANSLSMTTQSVMPFFGLALSGTALAVLYAWSPTYFFLGAILLNGLSFLVSALFVRRLPPLPAEKRLSGEKTHAWTDFREGLRYIRRSSVLITLLWLSLLIQLFIAPFMVVYVTVNREWFGGAYWTLALCESSFFAGVILASVWVGKRSIIRPGMAFIVGLALIGVTVALMAFSRVYFWFVFWNLLAGLAFPFSQIPMTTYIQRAVPNALQGRVNSVLSLVNMGLQPLAIGLGGLVLAAVGPTGMLLMMGIGMALASLGGLASKSFRTVETPTP